MANRLVPRTAQVVPGAIVNIVMKADQRSGREVSGTVRDVLTRGDHHRGIKVRLADGRIGRVQSMGSSASTASPSRPDNADGLASGPTHPTSDEQANSADQAAASHPHRGGDGGSRRPRYRDVRLDESLEVPPEQTDLSAYIVPARPARAQRKGKNRNGPPSRDAGQPDGSARSDGVPGTNDANSAMDVTSATATCPVCGEFEGDETAVAHHVATHFE
ncbi:kinesin-like nuclear fusion protein [Hypoxylon texense]